MTGRPIIMNKSTWQSIRAVVAGVLAILNVTTLVGIVLHIAKVYPPAKEPLTDALASSYRLIISIAGGYLTARLAPERPLRHAMILGYVGVVLGMVGLVATWNLRLGPGWYPISLVVLAIPQCWAGGKLYELRLPARTAGETA